MSKHSLISKKLIEMINNAKEHYSEYFRLTKKINGWIEETFGVKIGYYYDGEEFFHLHDEIDGKKVIYSIPVRKGDGYCELYILEDGSVILIKSKLVQVKDGIEIKEEKEVLLRSDQYSILKSFLTTEQMILIFIASRRSATVREVISKVRGSVSTILKAINNLVALGFLEEKREEKFPFRRVLRLSPKGEKVARYLIEIYKLLT